MARCVASKDIIPSLCSCCRKNEQKFGERGPEGTMVIGLARAAVTEEGAIRDLKGLLSQER